QPHAVFERKDNNVHVTVPVTLKEAVLGAKIEVPTVRGVVSMTIPKNSNTGDTLRLRGQGIKDRRSGQMGHQYVKLKVVLPEGEEPELARFLGSGTRKDQRNPRREMLRGCGSTSCAPRSGRCTGRIWSDGCRRRGSRPWTKAAPSISATWSAPG